MSDGPCAGVVGLLWSTVCLGGDEEFFLRTPRSEDSTEQNEETHSGHLRWQCRYLHRFSAPDLVSTPETSPSTGSTPVARSFVLGVVVIQGEEDSEIQRA